MIQSDEPSPKLLMVKKWKLVPVTLATSFGLSARGSNEPLSDDVVESVKKRRQNMLRQEVIVGMSGDCFGQMR